MTALLPDEGCAVATIFCGRCRDEGHPKRVLLGVLWRDPDGALSWIYFDRRRARLNRPGMRWRGWRGYQVLHHPAFTRLTVPDRLDVLCPRHGLGTVSTTEVRKAHGSVFLELLASA